MSKALPFTEAAVRRAINAARKAGPMVATEVTPDGTVRIVNGNRTTISSARKTYIYVVGFGPYVKIGFSENFGRRLIALQQGVPETLTVYSFQAGSDKIEHQLHKRFADYRLRGEWFRKEGELAAWIDGGCVL